MFDSPKAPEYGLMDTPTRAFLETAPADDAVLVCSRIDGDTQFIIKNPNGPAVPFVQALVKHSPTGMEWGYGGSGPADLALNILALFVDPREAARLHQDFKWASVAGWQRDHVEFTLGQVRAFVTDYWEREQADVDRMTREADLARDAAAIREADAADARVLEEGIVIMSDDFRPDDDPAHERLDRGDGYGF